MSGRVIFFLFIHSFIVYLFLDNNIFIYQYRLTVFWWFGLGVGLDVSDDDASLVPGFCEFIFAFPTDGNVRDGSACHCLCICCDVSRNLAPCK